MATADQQPATGAHPSIGGDVAPVLLRRLGQAHGLLQTDWEIEAAEQGELPLAPTILVTLRGSAREMEAALSLGAAAYVELGDDEELPVGVMSMLAAPTTGLHVSLSTITSFSLDLTPFVCSALVARGWLDAGRRADAELCVHEAVSNAIVHGNLEIQQGPSADVGAFDGFVQTVTRRLTDRHMASRRITVEALASADELCVRVSDQGRGHPGLVPTDLDRLEAKSGRGLRIMGELADRISFTDAGRTANLFFRR